MKYWLEHFGMFRAEDWRKLKENNLLFGVRLFWLFFYSAWTKHGSRWQRSALCRSPTSSYSMRGRWGHSRGHSLISCCFSYSLEDSKQCQVWIMKVFTLNLFIKGFDSKQLQFQSFSFKVSRIFQENLRKASIIMNPTNRLKWNIMPGSSMKINETLKW